MILLSIIILTCSLLTAQKSYAAASETIYTWYETQLRPVGDDSNKADDDNLNTYIIDANGNSILYPTLPNTMVDADNIKKNKSCIPLAGGLMQTLNRIANGILTLGISEWIYKDFSMLNGNAEGTPVLYDGYGNSLVNAGPALPTNPTISDLVGRIPSPIITTHNNGSAGSISDNWWQNAKGGDVTSGTMRCKVPSDDIYVCYTNDLLFWRPHCTNENIYRFCADNKKCAQINGQTVTDENGVALANPYNHSNLNTKNMDAYQSHKLSGVVFSKAIEAADNICVQILLPTGWNTMGCKKRLPDYNPSNQVKTCYVNPACASLAQLNSQNFVSIFGAMSYCLIDSFNTLISNPETCGVNYVVAFRNSMKTTILAMLGIYITIIGIKIIFGKITWQGKAEIFIFVGKIILVMYLAIGTGKDSEGRYTKSGVDHIYGSALNVSMKLLDIVINTTSSQNHLCEFDYNKYLYLPATGTQPAIDFRMLRVWDELDCRLGYYLGVGAISAALGVHEQSPLTNFAIAIALPLILLLNIETVTIALLLVIFFVFLLSAMIFIVEVFAACAFLILLLVIFAPIFVPMVLFDLTKQSFMAWWKLILGFTLQPMVIGVYIALMLPVMDSIIFPGCIFSPKSFTVPVIGASSSTLQTQFNAVTERSLNGSSYDINSLRGENITSSTGTNFNQMGISNMIKKDITIPVLDITNDPITGQSAQSDECKNSWGYQFAVIKNGDKIGSVNSSNTLVESILFPIKMLSDTNKWLSFLSVILQFTLFSVLFYIFATMVGGIAGDLTGTISIEGLTSGANAAINKAADLAVKAIKQKSPAAGKALEVTGKAVKNEGKQASQQEANRDSSGNAAQGETGGGGDSKNNGTGGSDKNTSDGASERGRENAGQNASAQGSATPSSPSGNTSSTPPPSPTTRN